MAQTNRDLRPYVEISLDLDSSPDLSSGSIVCLLGFVTDVNNLTSGTPVNEPIDIGNISSVSSLSIMMDSLGLQYQFTSLTTLDLDPAKTDPLAAMLVQSVLTYQGWNAYQAANTLATPRYVIGILDDTVNAKGPSAGITPFGDFFTTVLDDEIELTTIVPQYEYATGDESVSGNYLAEIRSYINTVKGKDNPNLGLNWGVFHTNQDRATDFSSLGYPDILNSSFFNSYQDTADQEVYQIPSYMFGAAAGMVLAALDYSCEGLVFQSIPDMPLPANNDGLFLDDTIQNMLQNGVSPLIWNKPANSMQFSRVVTSVLLDPDIGVARSNMLDFQDWKVDYEVQRRVYNTILFDKEVINTKAKQASGGGIAAINAVRSDVLGVLEQMFNEGLILRPDDGFESTINAGLNPDNVSQIQLTVEVYAAPVIYQVAGSVVATDPSVILNQFAINTQ